MKYAIWLDGVILDVDTTEALYSIYKNNQNVNIPISLKVHEDWSNFYSTLKKVGEENIIIMSPYNKETTLEILKKINLNLKYIPNSGKTKPSKEPFTKLDADPLDLIVIGSSPLDLLSARFYDSRIKVLCVKRYSDCSKYSPFLYSKDLTELGNMMLKMKLL
ncbi:HAD family hydrolase [Acidianus manzaensis]|uniref:HAD family hydrolase n=1 Tax=Acidianus manzaensis TaxID=282676 RepID=A0A1W6K2K3_9CREN|nr:HAD family hydrolase [Acidianus manzaensis]ARM76773.1 hypothetical protein B6F84_12610 [Acidianus manzaensis]